MIKTTFFSLLVGTAIASVPTFANADFPERPVTVIVPFSAGGGTDITTRTLADSMSPVLGADIVVKNTDGAGGTIGTAEVARAKADGYTIGMMPVGPLTTQPHLRKLPYDTQAFDYICLAYSAPQALVVTKDSPFNTLDDMIQYAKSNPDELNYGVQAAGGLPHLAGLGLAKESGIEVQFIPFKGSAPTFKALLDGSADMFVAHISFLAQNSDQLKPLALFAEERVSTAPDVPTAKEQGYDLDFPVWGGLVAPKGIPDEARTKLQEACESGSKSEAFQTRMEQLQTPVVFQDGEEFKNYVDSQSVRNGKLLEAAGMKK